MPSKSHYLYHITLKNRSQVKMVDRLFGALRRSFEKQRKPEDPTLKRYEVHERLIERGLKHPDTVSEVKELIAAGLLPPDGLN